MFPQFKATERFELVEIQVGAGYTQNIIKIPDQEDLRSDQTFDIAVQAIEIYLDTDMAFSPSNNPVATFAIMQNSFFTFYCDGEEEYYQLPMGMLHRINNFTDPYVWELFKMRNKQITWTKSTTQNPTGAFNQEAGFSIMLGVHYYKLPPGTIDKLQQLEANSFINVQNLSLAQMYNQPAGQ